MDTAKDRYIKLRLTPVQAWVKHHRFASLAGSLLALALLLYATLPALFQNVGARSALALLVRSGGRPVSAAEMRTAHAFLSRAAALAPGLTGPARWTGLLLSAGDPEAAIGAFDQLLARDPSDRLAHFWRGRMRARLGDETGALADWQAARAGSYFANQAQRTLLAGNLGQALQFSQTAVAVAPEAGGSWLALGEVYWALGQTAQSAEAFQRGLALPPPAEPPLAVPLARARLAWSQGHLEEAEAAYRALLPFVYRSSDSVPFIELARLLAAMNRTPEAEALLLEASAAQPANPAPLVAAGELVLARGDPGRARKYFERARAVAPAAPDPLLALARLAASNHDFETVGRLAQQVTLLAPDSAEAHHLAGVAHLMSGDGGAALVELRRAVALAPMVAEYHSALGDALEFMGQRDKAVAEYRAALALDPGHKHAALLLHTLTGDQTAPDR
ncbi:MAG: tetratricopeptide repeat protein [Ardenticatenaceae bacterium]|nr:tetratricopeptide repeat protein [Ardenticatenaceae bacterium]